MLFFDARFVPGFLPSFGVCPAFIGLAESEGFETPGHGMRYRGDERIYTLGANSCYRSSYLQYVNLSIRAILAAKCPIYARFSTHYLYNTGVCYTCVRAHILTYVRGHAPSHAHNTRETNTRA